MKPRGPRATPRKRDGHSFPAAPFLAGRPEPTRQEAGECGQGTALSLNPSLEASFTESALPLTMELARFTTALLEPLLLEFPERWRFEDKVLVLLLPSLFPQIHRFYALDGPPLSSLFLEHQLARVDRDLLRDLSRLLDCREPGIVRMLARLSCDSKQGRSKR